MRRQNVLNNFLSHFHIVSFIDRFILKSFPAFANYLTRGFASIVTLIFLLESALQVQIDSGLPMYYVVSHFIFYRFYLKNINILIMLA